jgi:hypothetical protein
MPDEKSEEAIVLLTGETTQLVVREGPLLQPCQAGKYVTVHARKDQPHQRQITRTSAQTRPEGQKAKSRSPGLMWQVEKR